ncbi:pyridoxamine 5'-phosphate oxidase [Gordonia neofelifaecis NRRL B-59395]|uniref:Pyridoxine/pyridoxamine 5'-phosphate oxidase n=2 Tax=Gordonia TaxID=2053 RepID=F1YLW1_9ACTN|nr:pyridoxamine 5'-phosphate oxidase [Gordonia neofelifaecis NRRL B-59395]
MRVGYAAGGDSESGADGMSANLDPSWFVGDPPWRSLFETWLAEAVAARIPEPNAMVVGTVDEQGHPATRTVLCKGVSDAGIVFFTGYESQKGRALATNPYASATFPWIALERQVHFRGRVVKVDAEETLRYWNSRPRGSQLSAYASAQSQPIGSRAELEAAAAATAERFGGADDGEPVPVPPAWGGYRIEPEVVEFWQGRANRLHNRARAVRTSEGWRTERLQP